MKDLVNRLTNKILNERKKEKNSFDYVEEGETCEQCGKLMSESECSECGYTKESTLDEKLYGKQKNLDLNRNNKIDADDFIRLRKKRKETKEDKEIGEGNAFIKAKIDAEKTGEKEFKFKGKTFPVKEIYELEIDGRKIRVSEEKMIDIIEEIVLLENLKMKPPKGYTEYERSVKKSKKENDDYLKSVMKKMKDYLKDGSKGDYEENPKHFPKNNGQLEKMKAMKYTMSKDGNEFLDTYMRPGMENLVPDEIEYDDEWVGDNIEGSSRTGNNPEWANADETDLGKKINKKRKEGKFRKAKLTAYRKSKQPITDAPGENSGKGLDIKTESVSDRKTEKLNEEFERMKNLISYEQKTQ